MPVQVNWMMITSRMCPIQPFQTMFQLHCRHKNSNSCCKEEHFKGEAKMFFVHILPWTKIHSHQFDAATLLKKMFEVAISTDLNRSNLQNFSTSHQP